MVPPRIKPAMAIALIVSVISCAGCWHHSPTPQQQYADALRHGNGAEAMQIWLHMSGDERMAYQRGEGVQAQVSTEEVQKQVARHYLDKSTPEEWRPEGDATVEKVAPNLGGATFQDLPKYIGSQNESAPAAPPPSAN
jgi:hypothetical protein